MKRILFYGTAGGLLIALLKFIEYKYIVRAYPGELYAAALAVIFTVGGVYAGLRWTQRKKEVVVHEVRVSDRGPFELNGEKVRELGITQRELEVLRLIAEGLSNREIGEKLFVSENTVKTHASRLFDKMSVSRRVQAVQKGRELGLIPW